MSMNIFNILAHYNVKFKFLFRFAIVGACGTIVNLLIILLLVEFFGVNAIVADVAAIECSILFNFYLNHIYTFRVNRYVHDRHPVKPSQNLYRKLLIFNAGMFGGH